MTPVFVTWKTQRIYAVPDRNWYLIIYNIAGRVVIQSEQLSYQVLHIIIENQYYIIL